MKWLLLVLCIITTHNQTTAQDSPKNLFSVCGTVINYDPTKPVLIALYSSAEKLKNMQYDKSLRFFPDKLPHDSLRFCFEDVKPGEYCVASFQDINNDRKLNFGTFGQPIEPYSFYKKSTSMFGPSFNKCKFLVNRDINDANLEYKKK